MSINFEQRTTNIYEELAHYPKPPLINQQAFDVSTSIDEGEMSPTHKTLFNLYLNFSRYKRNQNIFYDKIENIFRKRDKQSGALFAPVVSATIGLENDSRELQALERAAFLLIAARNFYSDLISGKLDPDKYDESILEMGQYPNCFSTTQLINGKTIKVYKSKLVNKIAVIIKSNYFIIEIGELQEKLNVGDVIATFNELVKIVDNESSNSKYFSPGILTCARNKTQINIFKNLLKIKVNESSYSEIKDCFLVLCLDLDKNPKDVAEASKVAHIGNPENRWYHSSLQIVVFGNSSASLVCNFSNSISGNVMVRLGHELFIRSSEITLDGVKNGNTQNFSFHQLTWDVNEELITKAKKDIDLVLDNQQSTFEFDSINKVILEEKKLKPVPIFILALQMTIKELIDDHLNITQFVAMSKFRCMDLTTANVTTKEVKRFVDEFEVNKPLSYKLQSLSGAIISQNKKIRLARKRLPIVDTLQMYMNSQTGVKKIINYIMFSALINLLVLTGYFKKSRREVIVSHPKIYDGVQIIGRPGVKIPYAKYFGLHYQIFSEKTVVTMMPGLNWKLPNKDFIKTLEKNLLRIIDIA